MSHEISLIANNLSCIRGERALFSALNFEVHPGQCLHVIGANGSGKSSLLRIVCGIRQPDTGDVQWSRSSINANADYLCHSAFIGHSDALKGEFTAIENLRWYQRLDSQADETQLDDLLAKMGILHCADVPAAQLSFGQRRRLAFARLLLRPYNLWILDEPFTGIDADGRAIIEQLCVEHLRGGKMIVMTHHRSLNEGPLRDYHSELRLN
ncbi:cytochrome c biogenesis ATP-binding export protein CcmA [Arenicella chitinivorans]|uniref:Cytochrome c biogenesis ATP-binding export protein CcmA n=1 Tax=Arenicella chitinivorans TaxID=1329800 RepID=A0A918VJI5_9GAMM|nr:cytochrome c biogenesis heme-transporting ATPase CcmA [Arenicella chitinivorans]GHA02383.1 cytochrome c biogenesis ATP-binding export protein CcmA [Arenicella chitinivorans]